MADDPHELPDTSALLGASLDDLQALYDAETAKVDPVDAAFYDIAHRLTHGDDALPDGA